jgi:pimeloyl-ACP methyl ester carboxylesterase
LWEYVKKEKWESITELADRCHETEQEHGRYLSTAFTARDMMRIVDALGEDGKLRFWGISYGTILGQVVASMFPDRMERVLLDSNSLADAYLTATGTGGPRDAEKSLMHFLDECVEIGPETCRLANYSGPSTTSQDLRTTLVDLFQRLVDTPELPADSGLSPTDYPYGGNSILKELKYAVLNELSSPLTYSAIDEILSYALEGNYKKALTVYQELPSQWNLGTQSFSGIACSDSSFRVETPEDLYSMYQSHLAESSFGDAIAADYIGCGAWRFNAAEGINTNELRNVNTSYPVLIINGAYDPFTSLGFAWQVASRFRGSRMLVHEGVGVSNIPAEVYSRGLS